MEFKNDSELIRIINSILELKEDSFKISVNNNDLNWTEYVSNKSVGVNVLIKNPYKDMHQICKT